MFTPMQRAVPHRRTVISVPRSKSRWILPPYLTSGPAKQNSGKPGRVMTAARF